jgi:hypothetical protein
MDGVDVRDLGGRDDAVDVEIGLEALGPGPMQIVSSASRRWSALLVDFGIHGHSLDAEFLAGADDPQGDFAAIRNQDAGKHRGDQGLMRNRRWPNSTAS